MIKNQRDLEKRLRELTHSTNEKRAMILATSDHTRDIAGSVQQGLYASQLALSLFRNLTNYHLPLKTRVKKITISLLTLIVINALRKRLTPKR